MSVLSQQLPLALQLRDDATFENFYVADNGVLVDSLQRQLSGGERYIYYYGDKGSGRSHLLQAACHQADKAGLSSVYLPLSELHEYNPAELLEGLEQLSLVCLDDIDQVLGNSDWEQQLFHLFNRLNDQQVCLLVSAPCAVRELNIELADLSSRLSWGMLFQITPFNDAQQLAVIQFRAQRRGLQLSDDVAQFIFYRCQRDTEALMQVLEQLDKASLEQKRRLTVPFVKSILLW
ncbi:DnaA regulatory inactivator Hda [Oceanicoccus sp. KOV_DT_Chl]|uniref:DnaA regulatory inactivator Hda n=1 Tax=Oceanicoccus sp. KOV_DT_Chl TaxID=1904639 RepID=UPI00190EFB03|nr:DnaA regulatory inactivator Hda [Oceanicoccus sp. KOV_DT_Chl]